MHFIEDLKQIPFIKMLLPLLTGIIVAFKMVQANDVTVFLLQLFIVLVFLILFIFHLITLRRRLYFSTTSGMLVSLFLFLSGLLLYLGKVDTIHDSKFTGTSIVRGEITGIPIEKTNSVEVKITSNLVNQMGKTITNKATILCYLQKDSNSLSLQEGDGIIFKADVKEIPAPTNPVAFNYKEYLFKKGISLQAYIPSGFWTWSHHKTIFIIDIIREIRHGIFQKLKQIGLGTKELAVFAALLLGNRSELTPAIKASFSGSGAMHILAVSGLHVGIFYLILTRFFSLVILPGRKYYKFAFILTFLWFYALLTGLSPSVTRATVMFSFILIGEVLQRKPNIYNSIFASAFLLLSINPFWLFSVGFQLSYLAVLSIVFFFKKIYTLLVFKNILLDKTWALVCLSISAQIGTLPVTLYYFNQFPLYFILTNIIVVPFAAIILYSGIVYLFVNFLPVLGDIMAWIVKGSLEALLFTVEFIAALPGSPIQNIYIEFHQVIVLYAFILSTTLLILARRKFFMLASFFFLIIFIFSIQWGRIKQENQQDFLVYNVRGSTTMQFLEGKQNYVITAVKDTNKIPEVNYLLQNLPGKLKGFETLDLGEINVLPTSSWIPFPGSKNFAFVQRDKTFLILMDNKVDEIKNPGMQLEVDFLVVTSGYSGDIRRTLQHIHVNELLILDSSNSYWQNARLSKNVRDIGVASWAVAKNGYWSTSKTLNNR